MSNRQDWRTPKKLYKELDKLFNFTFDPCPPNPKFNGLEVEWKQRNFINPPYAREVGKWVKKAYEESKKGKLCVMLLAARTDTRWFHDYCMNADEIWFIKGRLKFDDQKNPAPFPSMIVIFDGLKKNNCITCKKDIEPYRKFCSKCYDEYLEGKR